MKNVVKESIIKSLLMLIYQKDLDKITVTDITKNAGISRMSFYRNYKSIDEVIYDAIDRLFEKFQEDLNEHKYMDLEQFSDMYFKKLKENQKLIEAAKKTGSYEKMLQIIIKYNLIMMEKYLGREELTDDELLLLHYHSGGMYELINFCSGKDYDFFLTKFREFIKKAYPFLADRPK